MIENESINNTKELYELLDTALKIGLGALIGALSTYYTAKANQQHELKKIFINKKLLILDEIIALVEKHYKNGFNLIDLWYKKSPYKEYYEEYSEETKKQFKKVDKSFIESSADLVLVASKLKMIGQGKAAEHILNFNTCILDVRNAFSTNTIITPSEEELIHLSNKASNYKHLYLEEINRYLDFKN